MMDLFSKNKISILSRVLLVTASLLLITTFFFPLWQISLDAPQYPEGISLQIWSFKFTGDVQTVNILNHYIGMAPITEGNFPELKSFPIIFIGLTILGLLSALIGRVWSASVFTLTTLCFSIWAMYDFYMWEYNFGNNLNPDAALKMEDMVYQPPLIGEKTFLNITASSWPHLAGYAFTLSILLMVFVMLYELKNMKSRTPFLEESILLSQVNTDNIIN